MALEEAQLAIAAARADDGAATVAPLGESLELASLAGHTFKPGERVRDSVTGEQGEVLASTVRHFQVSAP